MLQKFATSEKLKKAIKSKVRLKSKLDVTNTAICMTLSVQNEIRNFVFLGRDKKKKDKQEWIENNLTIAES